MKEKAMTQLLRPDLLVHKAIELEENLGII